jgi:hypothetical protein
MWHTVVMDKKMAGGTNGVVKYNILDVKKQFDFITLPCYHDDSRS